MIREEILDRVYLNKFEFCAGLYKIILLYLGIRCLVHCTHARADIEQIQRLSEKAEAGKVHIE